jgi:hypothetical protein
MYSVEVLPGKCLITVLTGLSAFVYNVKKWIFFSVSNICMVLQSIILLVVIRVPAAVVRKKNSLLTTLLSFLWKRIKLASQINTMRGGLPFPGLSFVSDVLVVFPSLLGSVFCTGKSLSCAKELFIADRVEVSWRWPLLFLDATPIFKVSVYLSVS